MSTNNSVTQHPVSLVLLVHNEAQVIESVPSLHYDSTLRRVPGTTIYHTVFPGDNRCARNLMQKATCKSSQVAFQWRRRELHPPP
jgi:hypothetical protein